MAGVRDDACRLRCLEDPERRRQATEAETVGPQPHPGRAGINPKWTPQCHPAIMAARICNEINGLQVPKTGAKSPQENAATASYGV
jgi:hypothetical protein